jgi:phosphatidylinositol alpha 1,6-mannosyltransferase
MTVPMRVLFCTDTYPPQVNGVSVVTSLSVAGLVARGWECAVAAPKYPAEETDVFTEDMRNGKYELLSIPSLPFPYYRDIRLSAPAYFSVLQLARRFKPDLIHSETEFVIGRMGQLVGATLGIPLVSSYHTDFSRYTVDYGVPWLRKPVMGYLARFHRRGLRTYTPSGPSREDLLQSGVKDVEVWGRGVDINVYSAKHRSPSLRERLGLGDRFTFLYVGRLAAEKNPETIVEAYTKALKLLPPDSTRLVIAGAGPKEAAVRAAAPDGVIFLGYLDRHSELPALYASSNAFVFASLTETLGLVVLEAMSSGLPVIASPSGGVADHLRDGVNGIAYPPRDTDAMAAAMVALATNPERTRQLAEGARQTAEDLSWDHELDRLDVSYREVISRKERAIEPVVRMGLTEVRDE